MWHVFLYVHKNCSEWRDQWYLLTKTYIQTSKIVQKLMLLRGEAGPKEFWGLVTNGWSNSWLAVGRSFGLTCRHLRMKSRASLDKESGTRGGLPLPIINNACICHVTKILLSTLSRSIFTYNWNMQLFLVKLPEL